MQSVHITMPAGAEEEQGYIMVKNDSLAVETRKSQRESCPGQKRHRGLLTKLALFRQAENGNVLLPRQSRRQHWPDTCEDSHHIL